MQYGKKQIGFTLIELLVVVTIISLLAGLLLPALEEAIAGARQVACVSQLKQLQAYYGIYIDEYDGFLAPAHMFPDVCSPAGYGYEDGTWYGVLARYFDNTGYWNTSHLTRIGRNAKPIALCPSPTTTFPGTCPTYGHNICVIMNGPQLRSAASGIKLARYSQLNNPSRTFCLFDGSYYGMEHSLYLRSRVYWNAHGGRANFSFMDGHVEARSEMPDAYVWDWFSNSPYCSVSVFLY